MNEAETRAEHIDPALKTVGWGVVEGSRIHREYPIRLSGIEGHDRRGKTDIADYVLVYRNQKLLSYKAFINPYYTKSSRKAVIEVLRRRNG